MTNLWISINISIEDNCILSGCQTITCYVGALPLKILKSDPHLRLTMPHLQNKEHVSLEEGRAASKSPHEKFGFFFFLFPSKQFLLILLKFSCCNI
jgi:hypothetical protein